MHVNKLRTAMFDKIVYIKTTDVEVVNYAQKEVEYKQNNGYYLIINQTDIKDYHSLQLKISPIVAILQIDTFVYNQKSFLNKIKVYRNNLLLVN